MASGRHNYLYRVNTLAVHRLLLKSLNAIIESRKITALEAAFALREIRKLEKLIDKRDEVLVERLTKRKKYEYLELIKGLDEDSINN